MKARIGVVAAVLLLAAGVAHADVVDPQIIIRGGTGGTINLFTNSITIDPTTNPDCEAVVINALAGFTCHFRNESGGTFFNLQFTFTGPTSNYQGQLFGIPLAFFSDDAGDNSTVVFFVGGSGIPDDGQLFDIDFLGFDAGTVFHIASNVPEPGALLLSLIGAMSVLGIRRRR